MPIAPPTSHLDRSVSSLVGVTMAFVASACGSSASGPPANDAGSAPGSEEVRACDSSNLDTSPDHCGRCEHTCGGGECVAGECQPFVLADDLLGLPLRIQATADGFAWLTYMNVAMSDATGKPRVLWNVPPDASGRAFSIGKSWLVVAVDTGEVWRIRLDGTDATRVATQQMRVTSIRSRGDTFFWVSAVSSELVRLDEDGTLHTISADTCNPNDFMLDGDRAILLATGSGCGGILSVPLAGGPVQPIAQNAGWKPAFGALLGNTLVWTNFLNHSAGVMVTDLAFGTTETLTGAGKDVYPLAATFDGEHVYFSTDNRAEWVSEVFESGYVYALNRSGAEPVRLSNIKASSLAIAVRGDLVAWTHDGPTRSDVPAGTNLTWRIMARAK